MTERLLDSQLGDTRIGAPTLVAPVSAAREQGQRTRRRLLTALRVVIRLNLLLVILQALTAGLFLSGEGRAVPGHAAGAMIVLAVAVAQAVLAALFWRRAGGPRWFFFASAGFIVMVLLQMYAGHHQLFWLHVPIGVGMFGGLTRQQIWIGQEQA